MSKSYEFLQKLGISSPIIQAPMAGISNSELAAAVSNCGGLGSLGLGAASAETARSMIQKTRALTTKPFNLNFFCNRTPLRDPVKESAWLDRISPMFSEYDAERPSELKKIYESFLSNKPMFDVLVEEKCPVISFHFGLPDRDQISILKAQGSTLLASVTNLSEALQAQDAGMDAVIAQGWEAGGHRGCFDENAPDDEYGVFPLTHLLVKKLQIPVIAAGGIMDGEGISAALGLGAIAAQLGTAFVACDESNANDEYLAALNGEGAYHTVMTRVISGRPARCVLNKVSRWGQTVANEVVPDYPIAYHAGKALNAAATAKGNYGFAAHWAGQGAPLTRAMPAERLMETLKSEIKDT
ncbi:NAD(P)H-dependent flavin oxidoreductase [Flexibacterium corallicola]|uniref:NAD(P)H-dependent flavin oxidoreductase n=1 Tax=Flexibacterium corallicola TaxID=3037259 RepID=UPI00286F666A|nr:nitronate monooxygenase [Pseudovibrio sp. M1P-2-3]